VFGSLLALVLAAPASGAIVLPPVWRWSNPTPHGANVVDMAYADGLYVQVGERGQVFTSTDLSLWIPRETLTFAALRGVTWFGSRLVITGEAGTVLYSDDAVQFELIDLGTTNWLESVAASPDRVVAVGDWGAIYSSPNAVDWTLVPVSFTNIWLRGIAYGNGSFVTVGESGFIATSADGTAWQEQASGTQTHLNRVAWTGDRFLAVGDGGQAFSSSAGTDWQPVVTGATNALFAVAGVPGSQAVAGNVELRLSKTGAWSDQLGATLSAPAPAWTYYAALHDGIGHVVAGASGMTVASTETNGVVHWNTPTDPIRSWLWQVARTPDHYLAVGDRGTILSSPNGIDWDLELVPSSVTNSVLLGVGGSTNLFLAVGSQGTILWAANIFLWNPVEPAPTPNDLQGVLFDGTQYLVCGGAGTVLTSPNGTNWTARSTPTTSFLMSVERFPDGYVAVGEDGVILTSSDATSWTRRTVSTTNWLSQVRWLNGVLLAVGENGTILTSTNGMSWKTRVSGTERWLNAVDFVSGTWLVAGNQGTALVSPDLTNWFNIGTITRKSLYGLVIHEGQLITVGSEGVILRSQLVPPTTPVAIAQYSRPSGQNLFLFAGVPDQQFYLQSSTDLASWTNQAHLEFLDSSGTLLYLEPPDTEALPVQVYRALNAQ